MLIICAYYKIIYLTISIFLVLQKQVFCRIKVNQIEDQDSWWYKSCDRCKHEVSKLEKAFRCTYCPKSMPVPRKRYVLMKKMYFTNYLCYICKAK